MPERPVSNLSAIRRAEYDEHRSQLGHLFLTGNLKMPTPHPFFRRDDIEVILCTYEAGDVGEPQWHEAVDELETILDGRIGYREAPSGLAYWFEQGDFVHIPKGTCVKRTVAIASRTIAMKLPSDPSRVICSECTRECSYREAPYRAEVPITL
ncbi:MAG: hypothetical protein M3Q89_10695 [Verrucomicrobiota bacterium]|nr:hypothetical protein [Verrucomicrobiota bacterium]